MAQESLRAKTMGGLNQSYRNTMDQLKAQARMSSTMATLLCPKTSRRTGRRTSDRAGERQHSHAYAQLTVFDPLYFTFINLSLISSSNTCVSSSQLTTFASAAPLVDGTTQVISDD